MSAPRKRKRKTARARMLGDATKAVRALRLEFERAASEELSRALGFKVKLTIPRQRPEDELSAGARRARRKAPGAARSLLADQLQAALGRERAAPAPEVFDLGGETGGGVAESRALSTATPGGAK